MDGVKYSATQELADFLGWKIVENKDSKDREKPKKEKDYNYLLQLKQNTVVDCKKVLSKVALKNNKQHYTEARLVQLLEDNGIGRPSTFSTLIEKIQERGYVKKGDVQGKQILCKDFELENETLTETNVTREFGNEKNKLVVQPLGIIVMEFLEKNFGDMFNYDYTKSMEDDLDKICRGEKVWHKLCETCLQEIEKNCEKLVDEKKCEIKIDDTHYYIIGKHGPVIKKIGLDDKQPGKKNNVSFLPVKEGIDLKKLERGEYKLEDIIAPAKSNEIQLGIYKNEPLFLKKGKFGLYVTWGQNSKSLSSFGNRPIENIKLEDILEILEKVSGETETKGSTGIIRFISNDISIRQGKYGDYVFYKTSKMAKPTFLKLGGFNGDYKTCTVATFLDWMKTEYNI